MTGVAITGLGTFAGNVPAGERHSPVLDRHSAIALMACRRAIADSGFGGDEVAAAGVSMGTTVGSLRSMTDYTRDTLVGARPYHVPPGRFPSTVMNCAAGQLAIRHGLHGMNLTVAGGSIAFFSSLRLAARALRMGRLDAMLAGASEEGRPHPGWGAHVAARGGAAVFLVERVSDAERAGRHVDAILESATTGFAPGGEEEPAMRESLAACASRALALAGVTPSAVATVVPCAPAASAHRALGAQAARGLLGDASYEMRVPLPVCGRRGAAGVALEVAGVLMRHRRAPERDADVSLFLGWTVEGGMAAAVLRGFSKGSEERRG